MMTARHIWALSAALFVAACAGCTATAGPTRDLSRESDGPDGVSIRYEAGGEVEYAPLDSSKVEYNSRTGEFESVSGDDESYRPLFGPGDEDEKDKVTATPPPSDDVKPLLDNPTAADDAIPEE
jgi:hypothetical protein